MLKKMLSHTAIYGFAPQITVVVNFLTLPLITKNLSALDFGVSGIMTSYTSAISVLAVLGLRVVLINTFYKSPHQYKWAWRQIYGFLTLWNFIYALILGVLIYFAVPPEAIENRWGILLLNVGPLVFFGQTVTLAASYYQFKQQPFQIAIRSLIFGLLGVGLNILFITHYKMGYMGWFWSNFIVGMLSNLSYWYPFNKKLKFTPIYNFKWRLIKQSLKVGLPTIPHFYSSYLLTSSDRVIMNSYNISTGDIGKYSAAYSFGNIMEGFGSASARAISPLINQKYKEEDELGARSLVFILQLIYFLVTFLICIWLKEVFHFMIKNDALSKMYPLGIIIIMSYNYRPMYFGSNNKLMYVEKTNAIWKVSLAAGILNVVLNLVLLPFYGFEIAAYVTFGSLMYMGYAGYYYKIFKKFNTVNYYPALWLLATIVLTALSYFIVEFHILVKILISVVFAIPVTLSILRINKKL